MQAALPHECLHGEERTVQVANAWYVKRGTEGASQALVIPNACTYTPASVVLAFNPADDACCATEAYIPAFPPLHSSDPVKYASPAEDSQLAHLQVLNTLDARHCRTDTTASPPADRFPCRDMICCPLRPPRAHILPLDTGPRHAIPSVSSVNSPRAVALCQPSALRAPAYLSRGHARIHPSPSSPPSDHVSLTVNIVIAPTHRDLLPKIQDLSHIARSAFVPARIRRPFSPSQTHLHASAPAHHSPALPSSRASTKH
ncbi:hypothetical protein FB451DRAFT_1555545 [Mycena latifolia]|nr:hypothetical protein FB451DRAFT_1555545 [Mycena latifolia]